jgi:hypothetical protein
LGRGVELRVKETMRGACYRGINAGSATRQRAYGEVRWGAGRPVGRGGLEGTVFGIAEVDSECVGNNESELLEGVLLEGGRGVRMAEECLGAGVRRASG